MHDTSYQCVLSGDDNKPHINDDLRINVSNSSFNPKTICSAYKQVPTIVIKFYQAKDSV